MRLVAQIAAVLAIGAGVIHISAAGDHTDLPVMFAGFMVVATLQIGVGALLFTRRPTRLLIAGAIALMISSIGLWVLSRTAGLPFIEGGHLEPIGFKDGVTKLFEIASIPVLLLLLSPDLARLSLPSRRLGSQAFGALAASCLALMTPALLLGGGEQHTHEEAVALGIHEHDDDGHEELAHADDTQSRHGHRDTAERSKTHGHATDSDKATHDGHAELASAGGVDHGHTSPVGTTHEHGEGRSDGEQRPHEHDDDDGHDKGGHKRGGHKDGEHGHGKQGGEESDDGSGEQPVTISYEPQPRICVAGVCVP